jgi:hypothetical protein
MISVVSWIFQESESYLCQTAITRASVDSVMRKALVTKVYGECSRIGLMKPRKVSSNLTAICGLGDTAEIKYNQCLTTSWILLVTTEEPTPEDLRRRSTYCDFCCFLADTFEPASTR